VGRQKDVTHLILQNLDGEGATKRNEKFFQYGCVIRWLAAGYTALSAFKEIITHGCQTSLQKQVCFTFSVVRCYHAKIF
jgi:hypothetical protein